MVAMRHFKEKKASETAKYILEDKMYLIKERNNLKFEKVAKKKALLEAEK